MKILHIVSRIDQIDGGVAEVVPRICEEQRKLGNEVRLVAGDAEYLSESAKRAISEGVDMRFARTWKFPIARSLRFSFKLKKLIEENVRWADIVHTHGLWQLPCVIATCACIQQGKPFVMQPHGFLEPERLKKSKIKKIIFGALFERRALDACNCVIATSESEKNGIKAYGVKNTVEIVPIGIDTSKIDEAKRSLTLLAGLGLDTQKKTMLFFSRIEPIKGLDMLAEAWAKLKEFHSTWQLAIVGPDDRGFSKTAYGFFKALKLTDNVKFTGPIYTDDKYTLLKSVDGFVLPTRSENFGIAVQEALAAGLPAVCTKGAPWELIESYDAGRWVDVSVEGVRQGLNYIMSCGSDKRLQMGGNGKVLISENFGWANIIDSLIRRVYIRAMKGNS